MPSPTTTFVFANNHLAGLERATKILEQQLGKSPSLQELASYVLMTTSGDDLAGMICNALGVPIDDDQDEMPLNDARNPAQNPAVALLTNLAPTGANGSK